AGLFLIAAPGTRAQTTTDQQLDSTGESAPSGETTDVNAPAEFDPNSLAPGTEVRTVVAGESDTAAAYAAGDSVTGFSAADVEALGALSIADLAVFTPNLEIVTTGSTTPTFFIRGVGLNDFSANASGAVAIFQDDVAINAPAMQLGTLFDIEGVNILRGPVGKGAARNASAGAIEMYSRKPTGIFGGYLRSTYGNYNYNDIEGAIEAPVVEDVLFARFAFRSSFRDGYQNNGCGGITEYPGFNAPGNDLPGNSPLYSVCGEDVPVRGAVLTQPFLRIADGFSEVPFNLPTKVNDLGNWATRLNLRYQPTLDQDWIINGHVSRRDEWSRQGIAYGTAGTQNFPDGSSLNGILGGPDQGGFVRPQVRQMITDQVALNLARGIPQPTAGSQATIGVANQIGAQLDTDPYTGYYNRPGRTTNLVYGAFVNGEIALPHDLTLKTVSGYDGYNRNITGDTDQTPNTLFEISTDDKGWQFYQNLQLDGMWESESFDWSLGAFYLQEGLDVVTVTDFGENTAFAIRFRDYTQDNYGLGIYADFSWPFFDDFTLDGGVRFNWESKTIDFFLIRGIGETTGNRTETRSAPTGELRLTYNFRDDAHAYWKYTRGWKGGHFNAAAALTPEDGVTYAEPETNNAYETGLKSSFLDNKLGLDFSLFYYDYTDYQLFTVQNSSGATPEFVVVNAQGVEIYGAELSADLRPFDNTRIQARFSWLESTFTELVLQNTVIITPEQGGAAVRKVQDLNYSGNRMVNSPQYKVSLTAEQTLRLGRYGAVTARYDGAWTDTVYFDPTEGRGVENDQGQIFLPENTIGQEPYWLHNLLFIYQPPVGNWTLEAFVRNMTNEVYKSFAFDATIFQQTTIYFTGEPRMFGGTLSVTF
ncbi:TonB-dependent receptor, partial [Myxococcota bacterium]|nr:TonB-dependent receptor [Myxococcota bacterium]